MAKDVNKYDLEAELFNNEDKKEIGFEGQFRGDNLKVFSKYDTLKSTIKLLGELFGKKEEPKTK